MQKVTEKEIVSEVGIIDDNDFEKALLNWYQNNENNGSPIVDELYHIIDENQTINKPKNFFTKR